MTVEDEPEAHSNGAGALRNNKVPHCVMKDQLLVPDEQRIEMDSRDRQRSSWEYIFPGDPELLDDGGENGGGRQSNCSVSRCVGGWEFEA